LWEASPDADQKCAVRSYLLIALERSGDLSHKVDQIADPNLSVDDDIHKERGLRNFHVSHIFNS